MLLGSIWHLLQIAARRIQHIVTQMQQNVRQRQKDHYESIPTYVMAKEDPLKGNNFTDCTRICVLSTTTYHKNDFINLLLNRRVVSKHSEEDNVTTHPKDNFLIYNVPGLFDVHPDNTEELKQNIKDYFQKHNEIFHAVFLVFVTPILWTNEDQDLVQFVKTLFGDHIIEKNGSLVVADYIEDLVPSFDEYIDKKIKEYDNNEVSLSGSLRTLGLGKFFRDITKERCISVESLRKDEDQVLTLLENTSTNPTFTLKEEKKQLTLLEKSKEYKFVIIGGACFLVVIGTILIVLKFMGIYDSTDGKRAIRDDIYTSSQMPDSETSSPNETSSL